MLTHGGVPCMTLPMFAGQSPSRKPTVTTDGFGSLAALPYPRQRTTSLPPLTFASCPFDTVTASQLKSHMRSLPAGSRPIRLNRDSSADIDEGPLMSCLFKLSRSPMFALVRSQSIAEGSVDPSGHPHRQTRLPARSANVQCAGAWDSSTIRPPAATAASSRLPS